MPAAVIWRWPVRRSTPQPRDLRDNVITFELTTRSHARKGMRWLSDGYTFGGFYADSIDFRRSRRGAVMATQGWLNHYDDPDEYWDDEPLTPILPTRTRIPDRLSELGRGERATGSDARPVDSVDESWKPRGGSPPPQRVIERPGERRSTTTCVSMEVDRGLLPIRIDFRAGWDRHVLPNEVSDELLLAYRKGVSNYLSRAYSQGIRPRAGDLSINAIPDRRTMMMVLLETATWDEFSEVSSEINIGSQHEVSGRVMDDGGQPVRLTADRRYLRAIHVDARWVARVSRERIGDEVLWCADIVRRERPHFAPRGDYSIYSEQDLEYQLDRHRLQLLSEWVG